jgi:hypothetical protein
MQQPVTGGLNAKRKPDHGHRQCYVEPEMKADGKRDLACDQSGSEAKDPSQREMASGFPFQTRVCLKVGCPKARLEGAKVLGIDHESHFTAVFDGRDFSILLGGFRPILLLSQGANCFCS